MFFKDEDYALCRALFERTTPDPGDQGLGLMPNHTHLILAPPDGAALAEALADMHCRYAHHVNFGEGRRGFLWAEAASPRSRWMTIISRRAFAMSS